MISSNNNSQPMHAAGQAAASEEPRTFQTMSELSQYYDEKFRALRLEGRKIHENYLEQRRKLNEYICKEGAQRERYRIVFRRMRECYYNEGRSIWAKRADLKMDYNYDEAKLFLELEEKKKKENRDRETDSHYSYQRKFLTLMLFLFMLACTLVMLYITVTTPGCENTTEKVIHVVFFGIIDIFPIMVTYVFWQHLTYSREKWAKVLDDAYKFNEERREKEEVRKHIKRIEKNERWHYWNTHDMFGNPM